MNRYKRDRKSDQNQNLERKDEINSETINRGNKKSVKTAGISNIRKNIIEEPLQLILNACRCRIRIECALCLITQPHTKNPVSEFSYHFTIFS